MKDQFNDEHFRGLYSWLKVNSTNHQGLVKKLREKLIEALQTTDVGTRPKSAKFNPRIRSPYALHKVV